MCEMCAEDIDAEITRLENENESLRSCLKAMQDYQTPQREAVSKYGLEPGKLQIAWREGERDDPREIVDAVIDALAVGCVRSWPGDGTSCAAQIVEYWLDRAKRAESELAKMKKKIKLFKVIFENV